MKTFIVGLMVGLLAIPCEGGIITVDDNGPADFVRIQDAINASWDGDTVLVKRGTYRENISFNGRAITLTSEDPDDPSIVASTVIEAAGAYSIIFKWNEGSRSVLTGFTITGRGIFCNGTSPTILKNVITNCTNQGIFGQNSATPTIAGNTIRGNDEVGIYWCDGPVDKNTISQNAAGLAYCNGSVTNNVISKNSNTRQGFGGGLYYCDGDIIGNVITNNYAVFNGGGLYGCNGDVVRNIIAGNRAGLSGGGLSNCSRSVCNNTIVGNVAAEDGGGLHNCTSSVVRSNIIAFNKAWYAGGIHGASKNSYNSFWQNAGGDLGGQATVGPGDIIVDPLFAVNGHWDDNGTADETDDFWVHGDYHLKSQIGRWQPSSDTWMVDDVTSRCIDAGDPDADWTPELWPHGKRINMGAYGATPQASMSRSAAGHLADLNADDLVGYHDLELFADDWPRQEVLLAADLNRDGAVDFKDFSILTASWGAEPPPPTPPLPNPMTWATEPYGTSPYSVAMVAAAAASTDGSGVEYYFEDYYDPATNSGWISFAPGAEAKWEVTGLAPEMLYWYRVRARNRGNLETTKWSDRAAATTFPEDTIVPDPDPATWQTEPYATSGNSIRMVATTATDDSGVEYQFECTSHPIYSSGWQDSPTYEVGSLPKSFYTFIVRSRDKSPNRNTTRDSISVTVDLKPPEPDPMKWAVGGEPREVHKSPFGTWDYWADMTAAEATDESGTVQYYFQCTTQSGFSSSWQTSPTYSVQVGRRNQYHSFRVKARDLHGNETGWSPLLPTVP